MFRIRIVENDVLEVATVRNRMLYRFDLGGTLLSTERSEGAYDEFGAEGEWSAVDLSGARYVLKPRAIVRISRGGTQTAFVKQDWWPWALAGHIPPVAIVAFGAFQLIVAMGLSPSWIVGARRMARIRYRG
jgi:hypothetical protein